ncbi:PAS domain-containing protein [Pararhizobium mangrovi]|uniref:histidine kinase n=1 Tax=Pararhizobium mangrovi TaxID=2590452 RepID=A0A506UBS0_9HYPH|nr:PAS domain-containing protein [Pararhizobium mangrovi]
MTDRLNAEQGAGDPFAAAVRATRMPMIITDPRQDDNPIVFVNDAFCRLTGYTREESLGNNCRFLQGEKTDREAVSAIRQAVESLEDISIELLNYTKDGTAFWNALYLSPVATEGGEVQFFFSSQLDVTADRERERQALEDRDALEDAVRERTAELEAALEQKTLLLHEVDHRVKNNLQMISAMIRSQARFSKDAAAKEALRTTLSRVETLGIVHRRLYESSDVASFDLSEFIRETAKELVDSRDSGIELVLELVPVEVPARAASPLSLLLNEIITNAMQHAFAEDAGGTIAVRTSQDGENCILAIEDNGKGFESGTVWEHSFGRRLIDSLVRQIGGYLEWSDAKPGTRATITFPSQDPMAR